VTGNSGTGMYSRCIRIKWESILKAGGRERGTQGVDHGEKKTGGGQEAIKEGGGSNCIRNSWKKKSELKGCNAIKKKKSRKIYLKN